MSRVVLIRYGAMGEVARFVNQAGSPAGTVAVVRSPRGEELGTIIGPAKADDAADEADDAADENGPAVLRVATSDDHEAARRSRHASEAEFVPWQERIREWNVDLELIDLERTFDGKLILYVLNDRGPEATRLALKAAAAGFGVIEVQPVGPEGLIAATGGGGCGSCANHKR